MENAGDVRAKRSARAREMRKARSDIVRAGIRRAIPEQLRLRALHERGLATWVQRRIARFGPAMFGLARIPDIETISSVIREMQAEAAALKPEFVSQSPSLKPVQIRSVLVNYAASAST